MPPAADPFLPATDAGCEEVASRFRALSEPTRLRILRRLARGEASVGEIVADVGGTQANVSKHLSVLHGRALVERRKVRTRTVYRVSDSRLLAICSAVCADIERGARARAEALSRGPDAPWTPGGAPPDPVQVLYRQGRARSLD